MNTVVSEKGQITIPIEARRQLGLEPGTELLVSCENGRLVVQKKPREDVFESWRGRGKLPLGKGTDDYLHRLRDADGD